MKITLWDTAGQERYKSIGKVYYKGARGILAVYDITDPQSYVDIEAWLRWASNPTLTQMRQSTSATSPSLSSATRPTSHKNGRSPTSGQSRSTRKSSTSTAGRSQPKAETKSMNCSRPCSRVTLAPFRDIRKGAVSKIKRVLRLKLAGHLLRSRQGLAFDGQRQASTEGNAADRRSNHVGARIIPSPRLPKNG